VLKTFLLILISSCASTYSISLVTPRVRKERKESLALRTLPVMVTGTERMALRTTATPGRNSQRLHRNWLPSSSYRRKESRGKIVSSPWKEKT